MPSEVEICSAALNILGDDSITALSDNSDRARLCNRLWPIVRDEVTRWHPWNSAIARQALGQLASSPLNAWSNQFQLPTDPYCLRALTVNEAPSSDDPGADFVVEGRVLLTDESSVNLKYIKRITDPSEYDGLLYSALIHRLAWWLAFNETGRTQISESLDGKFKAILQDARAIDAQEGAPDKLISDDLTKDR